MGALVGKGFIKIENISAKSQENFRLAAFEVMAGARRRDKTSPCCFTWGRKEGGGKREGRTDGRVSSENKKYMEAKYFPHSL